MVDIAIIGGGPAGFSAAVNARARGCDCLIISADIAANPLARSSRVDNYLGMRGVSGLAMLQTMKDEAIAAGAQIRHGHALSVAPFGDHFMIAVGSDMIEAKRVILAVGVHAPKKLEGEEEHLGRGVSYCATCDGMLYRNKKAVVTGNADDLAEEAKLLQKIGVDVTVVSKKCPEALPQDIPFVQAVPSAIRDGDPITLVCADDSFIACDVVFILRNEQAMGTLVPGIDMNGAFVRVNEKGETNIAGLFAAGDCTGKPLQVAKAVSDGLIAAWSATDSLK